MIVMIQTVSTPSSKRRARRPARLVPRPPACCVRKSAPPCPPRVLCRRHVPAYPRLRLSDGKAQRGNHRRQQGPVQGRQALREHDSRPPFLLLEAPRPLGETGFMETLERLHNAVAVDRNALLRVTILQVSRHRHFQGL